MIINFSEFSTQELREVAANVRLLLNERTNSAIEQKAQTIAALIDEIYDLVDAEGGNPDAWLLDSYDSSLVNLIDIRNAFLRLDFEKFQPEE